MFSVGTWYTSGYEKNSFIMCPLKNLYMRGRIVLGTSEVYALYVDYRNDTNSTQNSALAEEFLNSLTITQ